MSARISLDSNDRALVAGARMLFGTLAAVIVALATVPLRQYLGGGGESGAFAASAIAFATLGSVLLVVVDMSYRDDGAIPAERERLAVGGLISPVLRNQAFLALSAAVTVMIVAVTVLDKSVLYYFKYALHDEQAGQLTLGWMMAISGMAIPLWLWVPRRLGARNVWFLAISACLACLIIFIAVAVEGALPA